MGKEKEESKETFSFEDGIEHNVDDLSDEGKLVYNKLVLTNKNKREFQANAQFELEKLDILGAFFANQLKSIVNPEGSSNEPSSDSKEN